MTTPRKPEILAPAGDVQSFLAAMAAGADAVYLGLKHFSARMQADNFGSTELSRMVELANANDRRIYVAFNTLVKPEDIPAAGRLLARLARDVNPHGLIVQDPGVLDLARQAGYTGGLFLSTLANVTHPAALKAARDMGATRVILPRELSIDEIRQIAAAYTTRRRRAVVTVKHHHIQRLTVARYSNRRTLVYTVHQTRVAAGVRVDRMPDLSRLHQYRITVTDVRPKTKI